LQARRRSSESNRPRPCHKHGYARLFCETDEVRSSTARQASSVGLPTKFDAPRSPMARKKSVYHGWRDPYEHQDLIQGSTLTLCNILELLHVTVRTLEGSPQIFHARDNRKAEKFVHVRVLRLLQGEHLLSSVAYVAWTRCGEKLSKSQRKDNQGRFCKYFAKKNIECTIYEYWTKGYPSQAA